MLLHGKRGVCSGIWLGLYLFAFGGLATPAAPREPAVRRLVLDPQRDPRLAQRISLTAERTTVGEVLRQLTRATGVAMRAGSPAVDAEPLLAHVQDRPLHSVLGLISGLFAWEQGGRKFGWIWTVQEKRGVREYVLEMDLPTRRLPAEIHARDQRWFAEEVRRLLQTGVGPDGRRPSPASHTYQAMSLLRQLPNPRLEALLQGRRVAIRWSEMPEGLRRLAPERVRERDVDGESEAWVDLLIMGPGSGLHLKCTFYECSGSGQGWSWNPEGFLLRWNEAMGVKDARLALPRVPSREFTGAAALPVRLAEADGEAWKTCRRLSDCLRMLHESTRVDLICDDYGYLFNWDSLLKRRYPAPKGEPLGFWLNALPWGAQNPHLQYNAPLAWSERDGACLIRNRSWYTEGAHLPPVALREWLRKRRRQSTSRVWSMDDVVQLFAAAPEVTDFLPLSAMGLLRSGEPGIEALTWDHRNLFHFWKVLDPVQRKRAFTPAGIRISDLRPEQQTQVTTVGPDRQPFCSRYFLDRSFGGDICVTLRWQGTSLVRTYRFSTGPESKLTIDMRVPDPSYEICRVSVVR